MSAQQATATTTVPTENQTQHQTTIGTGIEEKRKKRPDAWDYYERVLGSPKYFIAPMVDGSVLPFRILCRRHGADIGVTPMIYR